MANRPRVFSQAFDNVLEQVFVTSEAIRRTEVQRAGNQQWVEAGALHIRAEDADGFHVVYLEYGCRRAS